MDDRTAAIKRIMDGTDRKTAFNLIFDHNVWGDNESISGPGSTLSYTENLRYELPTLFEKYNIKTVFDAPCGDFHWMSYVLKYCSIEYTGADIVDKMIDSLNARFRSDSVRFVTMDLVSDPYSKFDLMICRDCLFHLPLQDIWAVFSNFVRSETRLLLTTSHKEKQLSANTTIKTGEFRYLDLFSPPFSFPIPLERIEDWVAPYPKREMCLWTREQLMTALDVAQGKTTTRLF